MKLIRSVILCLSFCIALLFGPSLAFASHGGPHDYNGIAIQPLDHASIRPMNLAYLGIMELAREMAANPAYAKTPAMDDIRTLMGFAEKEHAASLVFGYTLPTTSWWDENPMHITRHAALATSFEILSRLNKFQGIGANAAHQRFSDVNQAIFLAGGMGCFYSATTFNTAEFIGPDYGRFFRSHEMAPWFALLLGLPIALGFVRWDLRNPPKRKRTPQPQLA